MKWLLMRENGITEGEDHAFLQGDKLSRWKFRRVLMLIKIGRNLLHKKT